MAQKRVSQVVVGFGQAGLQGGGPPAVWQSFLGLAQVEQELAQVGEGRGKIGVDRQGAAKVVECLVFLIEGTQGGAQVGVRSRVAGAQGERLPECVGGIRVPSQSFECQPEVVEHPGIVQAELHRRAAARDDGLVEPHCAVGFRKRGPKDRRLRNELHGAADQIRRRAGMAHLKASNSQKVQGICVRCVAIEERFVKAHRRQELARLVKLDRTGEFVA